MGGGSGGHVTPVIAVVREIWKLKPRTKIEFWSDKKYYRNVRKIALESSLDLPVRKVAAGKLRRYTNFSFMDYLEHFDVVLNNVADLFRLIAGFCQSFWRLMLRRPDIIFLKGGYVCLPVGLAAQVLRVPYIVHDSDTVPGLTNRLLSRRATRIATGMPLEYYNYPEEKAEWTGIPVSEEFRPVPVGKQKAYKKELGFSPDEPLTVVTGGSLGAQHINEAVREVLPQMLKFTGVILVAGRERYPEMLDLKEFESWEGGKLNSNFRMLEFSGEMWKLFGAADVIVGRAGASTMTELASMGKATIMVPNQKLPGYHQVKNAEAYAKAGAAVVVEDERMVDQPGILLKEVRTLVRDEAKREELARNLHAFAKNDAAERIAKMVIKK